VSPPATQEQDSEEAAKEVLVTEDFEAPPWIAMPGQQPGNVAIRVVKPGSENTVFDQTYSVTWRLKNRPDTSGSIRDVELRVVWLAPGSTERSIDLTSWRVR
jgi:hypothetical protein